MSMTLEQAMRRAFSLGQKYWEQADSESWSKQDKAEGTWQKFEQMLQETLATPAQTVDVAKVHTVISELRAYNPRADMYSGKYVHVYWADKLSQAIKAYD